MKLYITLDIQQNDPEHLKGEDLDTAVEEALGDLDLDGWETKRVSVSRESFHKQGEGDRKLAETVLAQATELADLIRDDKGKEPWSKNPELTNTEGAAWTLLLLKQQKLF